MSLYTEKEMPPSLESSEGVAGGWGGERVGAKVIEIVKGLTNEDYESIVRNFYFILNMLVSHWRILSRGVTWSAFYSFGTWCYSGAK